jgi:GMP synthase-like glutamine amidotransferase
MSRGSSGTSAVAHNAASCLVVQHIEPEGPYVIGDALAKGSVTVDVCLMPADPHLPPSLDGYQGMVVMGGPMSATSDEAFPTRAREIELLEEAIERGLPTLGVCLGAQLLAIAAGGKVYPGADGPEIGWAPVFFGHKAETDPLLAGLPEELTVMHWHSETFDVPPGSTHLASSKLYPNQAFRVGGRAWGFQFHLEVDRSAVGAFLGAFGDEAKAAGVAPGAISAQAGAVLAELATRQQLVLERFAFLVSSGRGR